MSKSKRNSPRAEAKQAAVLDTAADVFAQYGFRRTTMNDIAEAAGISRPALYLMFDNKEHLFHELAAHRNNLALEAAKAALATEAKVTDRVIDALLDFHKTYAEPVLDSPHGDELVDVNLSLAADVMSKGHTNLVTALAKELRDADKAGEISFQASPLSAKAFVELLLSAIGGVKKKAENNAEYRKQTRQVAHIFLSSVSLPDSQ